MQVNGYGITYALLTHPSLTYFSVQPSNLLGQQDQQLIEVRLPDQLAEVIDSSIQVIMEQRKIRHSRFASNDARLRCVCRSPWL